MPNKLMFKKKESKLCCQNIYFSGNLLKIFKQFRFKWISMEYETKPTVEGFKISLEMIIWHFLQCGISLLLI